MLTILHGSDWSPILLSYILDELWKEIWSKITFCSTKLLIVINKFALFYADQTFNMATIKLLMVFHLPIFNEEKNLKP